MRTKRKRGLFRALAEFMVKKTRYTVENTPYSVRIFDANRQVLDKVVACDTVIGEVERFKTDNHGKLLPNRTKEIVFFPAPLRVVHIPEVNRKTKAVKGFAETYTFGCFRVEVLWWTICRSASWWPLWSFAWFSPNTRGFGRGRAYRLGPLGISFWRWKT